MQFSLSIAYQFSDSSRTIRCAIREENHLRAKKKPTQKTLGNYCRFNLGVNKSFWNETHTYSTESVRSAPSPEVLLPCVSEPLLLKWLRWSVLAPMTHAICQQLLCHHTSVFSPIKTKEKNIFFFIFLVFNEFGFQMVLNLIYC